ncbi:MAG TPA: cytochrome P450 [Polyangiaceae bacterium]|jgi:cytochrome P450
MDALPSLPTLPRRLPLVGHVLSYVRDPFAFFVRASQLGPFARVDLAGMRAVMVNDPDLVEAICVTQNRSFHKDRFAKDLQRVLGMGLLTSDGDFWRRQRRLAQPAFHRERIAAYAKTMVELTRAAADRWREGEVRDAHADMMELTLAIVGKTLFGAELGPRAHEIGAALEAVTAYYADPVAMTVPRWERLPTPLNRRFTAAVRRLDAIVRDLLRTHRAGTTGDGNDLLSMLLAARDEDGTGMSDDQLRDEAITILLAGHETTAIALTFTWMLLAEHGGPGGARARLEAEIDEVLGDRDPTVADVPRLVFADRIVRESMRLYPPAWSIGREAAEDVEVGGRRFPRGTWFWFLPWTMHRDARFFADPARFDPDRWEGDFAKSLPRFAYFPFGGGPRQCIGNSFATMETILCLVTIAQRWRLDLAGRRTVDLLPSVTLRPKHGLKVRLAQRPR